MRRPGAREVAPSSSDRPRLHGKFFYTRAEKLLLRGVTYGPFRPDPDGCEYGTRVQVERDFRLMHAHGVNCVRTYTVPPRWLLDIAGEQGLRVMVGLAWEQHIAFLDDRRRRRSILRRVRDGVRECCGHPAVLAFAIGSEIPAAVVRWYGARRIEEFLLRLYRVAKAADADALVTYVNYPTTEYLDLPFLDFVCFNVFLESQTPLSAYLARLQNLAGERPLVLGEIGLDSRRNGVSRQAVVLDWQIRKSFSAGCAGAFVFAWTDEWHRGGHEILDWDFGLCARDRAPKPALATVAEAFAEGPFPPGTQWPRICVVVCSYNGHATIMETLRGLRRLDYPAFEVIVVDDGSSPPLAPLVEPFGVRLIRTPNHGLSAARNVGMTAARGDIVAYIDDDAYPDVDWLKYLACTFQAGPYVAVGGPNLPPPTSNAFAECVANAPGGPVHVLVTDTEAEHIPGCNMAFRKSALEAVGGFDSQFRSAGDDVDLCWRLQERGWKIGYSPAAVVWHHRRSSLRSYWGQQRGYGRAEALLERKWPERYNEAGHIPWAGRVYADHTAHLFGGSGSRIYYGTWGTAAFQSSEASAPTKLSSLISMPEWYLVILVLGVFSILGAIWHLLLWALPLFALAVLSLFARALTTAARVVLRGQPRGLWAWTKRYALTAMLHLLQPIARLEGRLREGLSPWRFRTGSLLLPINRTFNFWHEQWRAPDQRVAALERALQRMRAVTLRGGDHDRWDLEVRGGMVGGLRLLMLVEEHGAGRQIVRVRMWPRSARTALGVAVLCDVFALVGVVIGQPVASAILFSFALAIVGRALYEAANATAAVDQALRADEPAHVLPSGGLPAIPAPSANGQGRSV